ncbi:MAG: glycosyltransferase [Chloroflexota bacterium]|nr:MAG: glycosyltransferase [Chloroflexota bacterium]
MVTITLGLLLVIFQSYALLYLLYLWAPALAVLVGYRRGSAVRSVAPAIERSFAILIPAHNEETVVGSLLESLASQHYPAEKRRVYVVADNCTDSTAAVVHNSGVAACHERSAEGGQQTKGAALLSLWEWISVEMPDCDCVLILDADNLVDPDFLAEMNLVFEQGYRVVQSARCPKNADDSWISQMDAISEMLWNRLDQEGRARLGLSASVAGSGMAFERDVFEWLVGNGVPQLLEDAEWQARLMLSGTRVGYTARAKLYDEKTRGAEQLSRQRKRWVAGVAIGASRYGWRALVSGIRSVSVWQTTAGFGATKPPRSLLLSLCGLLAMIGGLFPTTPALLPWPFWIGALGSFAAYVLLGMVLDGARPRAYLALLCAPVFLLFMLRAFVAGGLRPSRERWIPTAHGRGITIDQLRSE